MEIYIYIGGYGIQDMGHGIWTERIKEREERRRKGKKKKEIRARATEVKKGLYQRMRKPERDIYVTAVSGKSKKKREIRDTE